MLDKPSGGGLTFNNLIEIFVLRSLRTRHAVKIERVREALEIAEKKHGITHLLRSPELRTGAGQLFLSSYGEMVDLNRTEQLVMMEVFQANLQRIDFEKEFARGFWPTHRFTDTGQRLILVSPFVSFGRAVVERIGVSTSAIAERVNLGEPRDDVRDDYGLNDNELREALAYEAAA